MTQSHPLQSIGDKIRTDHIMAAARQRQPDFIVKRADGDYLRRWWVIPRNDDFNVYLHQFVQDDDDRALHDHPWHSVSLILAGGYIEHLPSGLQVLRLPGELVYRRPEDAHRVSLHRDAFGKPIEAWSLFITGARIRDWGFLCPQGWVRWEQFTSANDPGAVGRGCD
jgi:hypothetical protein